MYIIQSFAFHINATLFPIQFLKNILQLKSDLWKEWIISFYPPANTGKVFGRILTLKVAFRYIFRIRSIPSEHN